MYALLWLYLSSGKKKKDGSGSVSAKKVSLTKRFYFSLFIIASESAGQVFQQ